jgi:hypothetical protein
MSGQCARSVHVIRPAPAAPAPRLALVVSNAPVPIEAKATQPVLSDLERKVVLLSRIDRKPLGRVGGFVQSLAARTFGIVAARPLADDRLEALRRFAVVLRYGDGIAPEEETARFTAAGYDPALAVPIYALCGDRNRSRRDRAARRRSLILAAAIWAGILPPFALALSDYFEDDMLGSLGAMLAFTTLAPIFRPRG